MLVGVLNQGQRDELVIDKPTSVIEILEMLNIAPSTVLVIHGDNVIPQNAVISGNTELELIIVSSGG
jgi:sulfur carrier protein ThiS